MALITLDEVKKLGTVEESRLQKSAGTVLRDDRFVLNFSFDIFLSHSRLDGDVVLGLKRFLERRGLSVYVDWIEDPATGSTAVSPTVAKRLRSRMAQCKALFYAHSLNSTKSRWMPWEVGYFDGLKGNVAICPLVQASSTSFRGEEYLGLYPYVDATSFSLWIHETPQKYLKYTDWISSSDKLRPEGS